MRKNAPRPLEYAKCIPQSTQSTQRDTGGAHNNIVLNNQNPPRPSATSAVNRILRSKLILSGREKNDLFAALLLILSALLLLFWNYRAADDYSTVVEIRHNQTILHRVHQAELQAKQHMQMSIVTDHGKLLIDMDTKQGIAVLVSPCPDQICVHQPRITRAGQSILCLPEKVLISLRADRQEGELDAILR